MSESAGMPPKDRHLSRRGAHPGRTFVTLRNGASFGGEAQAQEILLGYLPALAGPFEPANGHCYDPAKLLVDPYAKLLDRPFRYVPELSAPRLKAMAGPTTKPIYVRADGKAPYAIVAQVMAALSSSGFSSIAMTMLLPRSTSA